MSTPLIRVVIVDDDADQLELLRTCFARTGRYEVIGEGASGPEAIELALTLQPHVLILDEVMPGLTGIDVVPDIVQGAPNTAVIVYTAESKTSTRDAAAAAGAHAVVGKLNDFDLLTGVIERILGVGEKPANAPQQTESQEAFAARMSALLETPERRRSVREWWSSTGTRWWVIVLAILSVPFIGLLIWLIAKLAGLAG